MGAYEQALNPLGLAYRDAERTTAAVRGLEKQDSDVEAITGRFPNGLYLTGLGTEMLGTDRGVVNIPRRCQSGWFMVQRSPASSG